MAKKREERIKELEKEIFILKHTKECVVCGKEFFAETQRKIYCSDACNQRALRKRQTKNVNDFVKAIKNREQYIYEQNNDYLLNNEQNIISYYKNRVMEY